MRFCCSCGNPVVLQGVPNDTRARFVCLGCRAVHYTNPRILVACFAYFDRQILLCRRAFEPRRGLWTLPAGFMEDGESLEQAAARETEEETGVVIDPSSLKLYCILSLPEMNQVYITLRTELVSAPEVRAGPESLEVALLKEGDLQRDEWAFVGDLGQAWPAVLFKEIETGQFAIHQLRLGGSHLTRFEDRSFPLR